MRNRHIEFVFSFFAFFVAVSIMNISLLQAQERNDSSHEKEGQKESGEKVIQIKNEDIRYEVKKKVEKKTNSTVDRLKVKHLRLIEKLTPNYFKSLSENEENKIVNEEAFKYFTNLKVLELPSEVSDLSFLKYVPSLEKLDLGLSIRSMRMNKKFTVKSLSTIKKLSNLKHLILEGRSVQNIPSCIFENLTLKHLNLGSTGLSEISFLRSQKKLVSLNLSYNKISDFSPLAEQTSLKKLYLKDCGIKGASFLKNLVNLKQLNLAKNGISDIQWLKRMNNLRVLNLRDNEIQDIEPVTELSSLEVLDLADNQIEEVPDLSKLKKLKKLYIMGNPAKNVSFRKFSSLTNLTHLVLNTDLLKNPQKISKLKPFKRIDFIGPPKQVSKIKSQIENNEK